jgi:hypothetical protein
MPELQLADVLTIAGASVAAVLITSIVQLIKTVLPIIGARGWEQALALISGGDTPPAGPAEARILEEARRLVTEDGFRPACVIRYDRQAYRFVDAAGTEQLRITFDQDIRCRFEHLRPTPEDTQCDRDVLGGGACLMEVKGATAAPYDFAAYLSARGIFPRSFSKYSESFRQHGVTPAFSA